MINLFNVQFGGNNISRIACGIDYTFCLTSDNKLYYCGNNRNGKLGRDGDNKIFK